MNNKTLLPLLILLLPSLSLAEQNQQPFDLEDPKPLLMQPGFKLNSEYPEPDKLPALTPESKANGDEVTRECQKLKIEYDKLKGKGKPQRRWALGQRYKAECKEYFDLHKGL